MNMAIDEWFCRRDMPKPSSQIIVGALKERDGVAELLRERSPFLEWN